MRIAVISDYRAADLPGGAEVYAESLAASLRERHEVTLLATALSARDAEGSFVPLPGRAPLKRNAPLAAKAFWHLRDQWLPRVQRDLVAALRDLAPDAVQSNNSQGLSAAMFTAVAKLGLPHVHTAHDLSLACAETTMTRRGDRCGRRCAACLVQRAIRCRAARASVDRLVAVSNAVALSLTAARCLPPERIVVVPLGAHPGPARLREWTDGIRLGFIGDLSEHKGLQTLLDAFSEAPPGWTLTIAGEGPLEPLVHRCTDADDRIVYLGRVANEAKDRFYDRLDLLVVPSECEEAATFVAREAAVRGIPAVVSDRGGLPETPQSRSFPARHSADLLEAVRWFAEDGRLRRASERLLASRDEFNWDTHARTVERILIETAESPERFAEAR
jgi:glycosyltransferase involved in cell wall biosynthesis